MAEAGIRAFFRIAACWDLSSEQGRILLGRPARATYFNWKKGLIRGLSHDTLCRLSYLLGIWKALQILFPREDLADDWLKKSNGMFEGQSALERMLAGDVTDLAMVRAALDSVRGGGL